MGIPGAQVLNALFINSGILGQRTFARFIEDAVLVEAGRLTGEQIIVADDLTLAERLRRRVLCTRLWPDGLGGLRNLDLRRYRAELNAGLVASGRIARLERAGRRFDVLHFHRQATAYASLDRMRTTPSIVSIDCTQGPVVELARSDLERRTYQPNVRRDGEIFRAARLIIATSRWAADSVRREYPDCTTEVAVMHSPVQLSHFNPEWIARRHARSLEAAPPRPRVLFVGGDFARKGGYDLLQVWKDGRFGERAALDLMTSWPIEGGRLSEGVAVHRDVHSFTDTWRALWRDADIFALPTRDEAFGTVFQEAAAAGLPAIGTSINAVPELIAHGASGLLVPPHDNAALARALETLLASADLRRTMGEQARALVEWSGDPLSYRDTLIDALQFVAGKTMCGIAGIVYRVPGAERDDDRRRLAAALDRLQHRGPDDEGTCERRGALLGHRRLSILDLSPAGHQPMPSKDGRLALTFNGEIYNYLELRAELQGLGHVFHTSSDTEVLLAAYEQWGAGALEKFRGMFAFGLWNDERRTLLLARDRVGERPLFYWRDADRFVFASELKAVLELIPGRPALSAASVDAYLHYQYPLDPDTMLEGVHKLPAGHFLELSAEGWTSPPKGYWSLTEAPARDGDPVEGLRAALDQAMEFTLRSDAPLGVGLSGGIDSGLIAALARKKRADVTAFTVGYPGAYRHDERNAARELALELNIPWKSAELTTDRMASFFPALVRAMDEPVADVAAYGHYAVSRLAAEHGVKVLLTGIGGDELFFGYEWVRHALRLSEMKIDRLARGSASEHFKADAMARLLDMPALANLVSNRRLPAWWRARAERALDYGRLDLAHPDEWVFYQIDYHWRPARRHTAEIYSGGFAGSLPDRSAFSLMRGMSAGGAAPQIRLCQLLFDSWLISNCLGLGDRMSMASSVETRVPLLDSALIDATVGYWKGGRADDSQGHKLWLRAIARDVLPARVLSRPKLGFTTPTVEWMAAVNSRYSAQLLDGTLVAAGVVDADRVRRWLGAPREGVQRDFFQYKLTLLEMWHRVVMEGEPIPEDKP